MWKLPSQATAAGCKLEENIGNLRKSGNLGSKFMSEGGKVEIWAIICDCGKTTVNSGEDRIC